MPTLLVRESKLQLQLASRGRRGDALAWAGPGRDSLCGPVKRQGRQLPSVKQGSVRSRSTWAFGISADRKPVTHMVCCWFDSFVLFHRSVQVDSVGGQSGGSDDPL